MDLLYISPSPPNELERVRSLNLIKAFKENNINVTLVTLYNKKQEKYLNEAKKYVDKIIEIKYSKIIASIYGIISLILPIPVRVGYCFNFRLIKTLKKLEKEYDIVYIKRLRMAQYKKYMKAKKTFIDITDSLTKYYERLYKSEKTIKKLFYLEEYLKLKRYELKVCRENKNIIICSEDDKDYICKKEDIELIKSPVGYPARGVRTNLLDLVDKRMGPKINCISNCVAPCGRGKEATKVGYCIADRLFDAWSGKKENACP